MSPENAPPFTFGKHIMIDLETLSTEYNACIVSIGAAKFTFKDGVSDTFYTNICPKSSKGYGLIIDKDTVNWWSSQPKEARLAWQTDPVPLPEALNMFNDFMEKDVTFWCKGGSFDFPILNTSYKATQIKRPWNYWQEMDLRTVFKLVGFDKKAKQQRENDTTNVYHNALGDAIAQIEQLRMLFDVEAF